MKYFTLILITLLFISKLNAQELDTILAIQVDSSDHRYEISIDGYEANESWRIWSMPMEKITASSNLEATPENNYEVKNLSDKTLKTAWIEGAEGSGIGEKIEFIISYPKISSYEVTNGWAYTFFGQVNLFNGYCKSLKTWTENSRVKNLRVYYNDLPICIVKLIDTWHFQYFNIEHYFKDEIRKKYLTAPHKLANGDKLTFEIIEVYKGTKYQDCGLSEFIREGQKN